MSVVTDWHAAPSLVKANFFEFIIEQMIHAVCTSGDVAVDAGANYGAHTATMLSTGARTHAFEPHPELAARLEAWGHESLTVHRVALSDRQGVADFHIAEDAGYGSLQIRPHQGVRIVHTCEVMVARLDDFALSPKLIKADVEGEEVRFLNGAWSTLEGARPLVFLEFDRQACGEGAVTVLNRLPEIGYGAFSFFGEPLAINDWDAWNILLYPEMSLTNTIRATLQAAGLEFFRNRRDWNPYQKLL